MPRLGADARRRRRPPAYTPPYDHALAAALARQGLDVRAAHVAVPLRRGAARRRIRRRRQPLRPARPGSAAVTAGSRRRPSSIRSRSRGSRLRRLRPPPSAVGLGARSATPGSSHARAPLVFTAHDLLPRRTARRTRTWRRLFGRFDRVVTHSERGPPQRSRRSASRPAKLRVIPHPAFRSDPAARRTTAAPCSRSG